MSAVPREGGSPRLPAVALEVISEGYDRETEWFQPRAAVLPDGEAVLTLTKSALWGSDIFLGIYYQISTNGGSSWSAPALIPGLVRREMPDGFKEAPSDFTGQFHKASGKVLYLGGTAVYEPGEKGGVSVTDSHSREVTYFTFDPQTRRWSDWLRLSLPDSAQRFYWAVASCCDRVDLDDGEILQPIYGLDRGSIGDNSWTSCYRATVLRLRFDGEELHYIEHGDELTVPEPRGFSEPSLTCFHGRFFLTLRNDVRGYVARSDDGLHFDSPIPWMFDDGEELGSYNTQQHWLIHGDDLFLSYTRRGADNDFVVRHRAPLFLARVDPERMCVIRDSEQVIVPNTGAQLGNFGTTRVSREESWVITSEGMQGDAEDTYNLELTENRGANARVYLARIQ